MKGSSRQPLPANIESEIEKHEIKRKMYMKRRELRKKNNTKKL